MADGAYRWQGNWPGPDAARVAEIDAAWDESRVEVFAESVRAAAVERIGRALAATRTGDPAGAAASLSHARSVLDGLDPVALEPRRGLAGLLKGRGARLKRFREAWTRAAAGLAETTGDLSGRVAGADQRSGLLDKAWVEIREALADLDAHLAAASARLSDSLLKRAIQRGVPTRCGRGAQAAAVEGLTVSPQGHVTDLAGKHEVQTATCFSSNESRVGPALLLQLQRVDLRLG